MTQELSVINEQDLRIKYIGFIANFAETSRPVVNTNLKNFFHWLQEKQINPNAISQDVINVYLSYLRESEYQNSSYNQKVSNLKNFLEYVGLKGLEYKRLKVGAYDKLKLIDKQSFAKIISFLCEKKEVPSKKQLKYLSQYILFQFMYLTGLRKNEVINLKYLDLTEEGGKYFYTVTAKFSKIVKKEYPMSLIPDLFRLKELTSSRDANYIFRSRYSKENKHISGRAINYLLNYYYQKVTGKKNMVTVHSIRNLSGIEVYTASNNNILFTMSHLNHNQLNTTHLYLSKVKGREINYYEQLEASLKSVG